MSMKLEGMHHITMITGDARKNVEFYADVLGLRLVKKTVNFDAPDAYHLYFGDEPGSILTWFEFAGAWKGRAGAGMIHTIKLGVASEASLDFWAERLAAKGYASERGKRSLTFEDYDGLRFELVVADDGNPPLRAVHPEVPAEHAILGVEGARAHPAAAWTPTARFLPIRWASPGSLTASIASTATSATSTGATTSPTGAATRGRGPCTTSPGTPTTPTTSPGSSAPPGPGCRSRR
jgi:catechol 2,3-dioxygenase-like lactoylglutathione lyase family enzyme